MFDNKVQEEERKGETGFKGTKGVKEASKSMKNTGYEFKQAQSTQNAFKRTSPTPIF